MSQFRQKLTRPLRVLRRYQMLNSGQHRNWLTGDTRSGRPFLVAVLACVVILTGHGVRAADRDEWKDRVICGPNAVLMFLILSGTDPGDDAIDSIDMSDQGVSMLQLRDFCEDHGVAVEIRQFENDQTDQMDLPAIWQVRKPGTLHYFVVHHIDAVGIQALDGTTGRNLVISRSRVEDFFTGYALVPRRSPINRLLMAVSGSAIMQCLILGGNLSVGVILLVLRGRHRVRDGHPVEGSTQSSPVVHIPSWQARQ